MKILCLTLSQGEVCTDDANANDNNAQNMIEKGSLVDKPNDPIKFIYKVFLVPERKGP